MVSFSLSYNICSVFLKIRPSRCSSHTLEKSSYLASTMFASWSVSKQSMNIESQVNEGMIGCICLSPLTR